jgi:hypothetical protein
MKQEAKSKMDCIDLLKYIFNDASAFYQKIAPDGLKNTEYILFLHPSPEQQYEEYIRIRTNLDKLIKKEKKEDKKMEVSDFQQDDLAEISEHEDFLYILGLSLWDIFSNNHDVVGEDNQTYHLGSFRGSARFIADFLNDHLPEKLNTKYDYLDFYMGTYSIETRGDLSPFYEYIFQKLKEYNCDWIFSFPQTYLIEPKKIFDDPDEASHQEDYNAAQAARQQLGLTDEDKQIKKFKEMLESAYSEAYEEAKYKPVSPIVQAYRNVYGCLPEGHPQKEFE